MDLSQKHSLLPLVTSQQELFEDMDMSDPLCVKYGNMLGFWIFVPENFRADTLSKAWNQVVKENDALCLRLVKVDEDTIKQYFEPYEPIALPPLVFPDAKQVKNQIEEFGKEWIEPFSQPLWRAKLLVGQDGSGALAVRLHHAVCDGYSIHLFVDRLKELYFSESEEILPAETGSFRDVIESNEHYLQSKKKLRDAEWWEKHYKEIAKLSYSIPTKEDDYKSSTETIHYYLGKERSAMLEALSLPEGVTFNSFLMTLLALTVYRLSGKTVFRFFVMFHGRRTEKQRHTAGCMIGNVPMDFCLDPQETVWDCLQSSSLRYMDAFRHCELPLKDHPSTSLLNPHTKREDHDWMVFNSMLFSQMQDQGDWQYDSYSNPYWGTQFQFIIKSTPDCGLRLSLQYHPDNCSEKQIETIMNEYGKICDLILEDIHLKVSALKKFRFFGKKVL